MRGMCNRCCLVSSPARANEACCDRRPRLLPHSCFFFFSFVASRDLWASSSSSGGLCGLVGCRCAPPAPPADLADPLPTSCNNNRTAAAKKTHRRLALPLPPQLLLLLTCLLPSLLLSIDRWCDRYVMDMVDSSIARTHTETEAHNTTIIDDSTGKQQSGRDQGELRTNARRGRDEGNQYSRCPRDLRRCVPPRAKRASPQSLYPVLKNERKPIQAVVCPTLIYVSWSERHIIS